MKKLLFILIIFISFCFTEVYAQIDVKQKAKNKSINRADNKVDQGIDKGLDKIEEGVGNIFKKRKKDTGENKEEEKEEESIEQNSEEEKPADEGNNKSNDKKEVATKLESYTKYDFVPGDKVLFFDDFSQDAVGDFPALWTTNGSGEIRNLNLYPGNWFYLNAKNKSYNLMKDLDLPENFIFEFDALPTPEDDGDERCGQLNLTFYNSKETEFLDDALYPGLEGLHVRFGANDWNVIGYNHKTNNVDGGSQLATLKINKLSHVIIWCQKRRLRIYHEGQKVLDMPTLIPTNAKFNRLRFSMWSMCGFFYLTNLRITTAAPDTRSKLLTDGKLISYGIYFDSGKDVVKPESYGALNDIAKVLKENPDVKIKIVGHTDSDGDDKSNLDLSKRRAANIKSAFSKDFGIDDSRMETDGLGESQPIAPNTDSQGKGQNRRVEFLKL